MSRGFYLGLGLFFGAIGGFILAKYTTKTENEEMSDEEVKDLLAPYKARIKELEEELDGSKKSELKKKPKPIQEKPDLDKLVEKYGGSADEEPHKPYPISAVSFANEQMDYEKVSLTCYADGVVSDDLYYEITNADDILGDFRSTPQWKKNHEAYIRNDVLQVDYEIVYEDVTFDEAKEVQ